MTQNNITETRTASIHIDKNDIVIITMKNCGRVDEYDVVDYNLALRHLTGGKPALKLFDGRANWNMDRKAKERAKLENSAQHTIARAVVVSNFIKAALFKYLHELGKKDFLRNFLPIKMKLTNGF